MSDSAAYANGMNLLGGNEKLLVEHTLEALAFEVGLPKLLLDGAKIGWVSLSDDGKSGVRGGVRSLNTRKYRWSQIHLR